MGKVRNLYILKGWKNQPAIVGNNECVGFFQTPSSVQSQCLQRKRGWLVCGSFCSKTITLNVGETHSLWLSCTGRNWTAGWKQSPKHSFPISLQFAKSMSGCSIQRCYLQVLPYSLGVATHVITFFFNLHLRCSVQQFYTKKSFFVIKLKNSCILFSTKSHFNAQQLEGNQLWITDKRKKHPKHQIFASIWPAVFRVVFGNVFSISCRGSLSLNRSRLADKTATRFLKRDYYAEVASVGAADASAHRCQRTPWQNRATSQPSD